MGASRRAMLTKLFSQYIHEFPTCLIFNLSKNRSDFHTDTYPGRVDRKAAPAGIQVYCIKKDSPDVIPVDLVKNKLLSIKQKDSVYFTTLYGEC